MTEENKKTIISFIAGLLVGGLLVFIFSEPATDSVKQSNNEVEQSGEVSEATDGDKTTDEGDRVVDRNGAAPTSPAAVIISDKGAIGVIDQRAGNVVKLETVEFPAKAGWIGVREYENGQLSGLLGVARFNTDEGLLPESVQLLRSTVAGKTYAVVFYSDNGDKTFSLATDGQFSGVMETFKVE